MSDKDDPRFHKGIDEFNERLFFECHETLEEIWLEVHGEDRKFYQGLIHAAVSLFHFEEGNLGGARKMHDSTRKYLEPFAPEFMGLDLAAFLADYADCFKPLIAAGSVWPEGVVLDPNTVPELRWKAE